MYKISISASLKNVRALVDSIASLKNYFVRAEQGAARTSFFKETYFSDGYFCIYIPFVPGKARSLCAAMAPVMDCVRAWSDVNRI